VIHDWAFCSSAACTYLFFRERVMLTRISLSRSGVSKVTTFFGNLGLLRKGGTRQGPKTSAPTVSVSFFLTGMRPEGQALLNRLNQMNQCLWISEFQTSILFPVSPEVYASDNTTFFLFEKG
jgi:hypothetical protein